MNLIKTVNNFFQKYPLVDTLVRVIPPALLLIFIVFNTLYAEELKVILLIVIGILLLPLAAGYTLWAFSHFKVSSYSLKGDDNTYSEAELVAATHFSSSALIATAIIIAGITFAVYQSNFFQTTIKYQQPQTEVIQDSTVTK